MTKPIGRLLVAALGLFAASFADSGTPARQQRLLGEVPSRVRPTVYEDNPYLAIGATRIDVRQGAESQITRGFRHEDAMARLGESAHDPYHLVKFATPVGGRQRGLLAATGFKVLAYYPYNTFLVRALPGRSAEALADIDGVSWTGRFHPQFKLGQEVIDLLASRPRALPDATPEWGLRFVVGLHEDEHAASIGEHLAGLPGVSLLPTRGPLRIRVEPDRLAEALQSIAALPQVSWIEPWHEEQITNDQNVQTSQSGACSQAGPESPNTTIFAKGLTGWNTRIAIADTCVDANEGWFYDAALGALPPHEPNAPWTSTPANWSQRKLVEYYDMYSADVTMGCNGATGCGGPCADHGTHVAGSAAGNCNLDLEGLATRTDPANRDGDSDGMAPGAKLVAQDLGNGTLFYLSADGGTLGELINLVQVNTCNGPCGIDIHNNSWTTSTDNYETHSRTGDASTWQYKNVSLVVAAGNAGVAGYNSVRAPSVAKNAIGVGSALQCTTGTLVSTSGRGDTSDGRLKPDIIAGGDSVTSAQNDGNGSTNGNGGCQIGSINGTSMAAGTVSGLLALIHQYYADGFYPSGAASVPDVLDPSGMLRKATLIASGRRIIGGDAEPTGVTWPNMDQGYGFAVLDDALYFAGDTSGLWVHDEPVGVDVTGTASLSFQRGITSGAIPLKVTLVWYDREFNGSCGPSTPCLVNDLDLTVTNDTTGAAYSVTLRPGSPNHLVPRTLIPLSGNTGAGQTKVDEGPDDRNTVEQIIIYNPASPANYSFTVSAANTPDGPIPFALVATGALGEPCPSPIAPAQNSTADDLAACFDTGVSVTWNPQPPAWNDGISHGPRYYQVLRDGQPIETGGCAGLLDEGAGSCIDDTGPDDTFVTYTVRYRNGCGGTYITGGESAADLTGLVVDVSESTDVCPTVPVMLQASVLPAGGSYTYQWLANGDELPGETGPTLTVAQSGIETLQYNCRVTDTVLGCASEDVTPAYVSWMEAFPELAYDSGFEPQLAQTCGDGDEHPEPGEVWQVTTRLANLADCGTATNSRADLALSPTSPAAATLCGSATGYYGSIAGGGTASQTHTFKIDGAADCGLDVDFDVNEIWWFGGTGGNFAQAVDVPVGVVYPGTEETATQFQDPLVAAGGISSSVLVPATTLGTVLDAKLDYQIACSQGPLIDLYVDAFDTLGGWTVNGGVSVNNGVLDSCGNSGGNNAYFNGSGTITRTVTTVGREDIEIFANFRGDAAYTAPGQCFRWYYSVNGGGSYILYKEFCGAAIPNQTWQCGESFTFPASAADNPNFRVRFETTPGVGVRLDRMRIRGHVPICDVDDDVRIEVDGPGAAGVLLLKEVGFPDPPKPIDLTAYYNSSGGGPGSYRLQVTETTGGTATITSGVLEITNRPPAECDVSPSCNCPGGPPGEVSDDPPHRLGVGKAGAFVDLLFEDLGATSYNVYVSTAAPTLPFVTTGGLGKADCAVVTASAPGGMRSVTGYDVEAGITEPSDIHFILVTADNAASGEGTAGFTSAGTERSIDTTCAP